MLASDVYVSFRIPSRSEERKQWYNGLKAVNRKRSVQLTLEDGRVEEGI